tara:strand:- start:43 stop:615 length:573 start_codon:yes stop_codon:yes gene_type:complete
MSVITAIRTRRSNPFVQERDVSKELIERILDAAVCTPVHYNTNPWRFLVIRGEGRARLGSYMAQCFAAEQDNPDSPEVRQKMETLAAKPFRAPVIIVVAAARSDHPKALMAENVASASVACQNILLAAEELGLACIWRTGSFAYNDRMRHLLGFEEGTQIVGFMYLGHPVRPLPPAERPPAESFTRWLED